MKFLILASIIVLSVIGIMGFVYPVLGFHANSFDYVEVDKYNIGARAYLDNTKNNVILVEFAVSTNFKWIEKPSDIQFELIIAKHGEETNVGKYVAVDEVSSITVPDGVLKTGFNEIKIIMLSSKETGKIKYGDVVFEEFVIIPKEFTFTIDVDESLILEKPLRK